MSYLFIFKYVENIFTLVKHAYKLEIFQENSKGSVKLQTLWESLSVTNPLLPLSYVYLPACC